jgi:hypothetical protein
MMASAKEGVMRKVSAVVLAVLVAIALASCSGDDGSGTPDGPGWTRLSPEGLQDLMSSEDVYLVNVHVPFEGEITGTDVHIPYTDLVDRLGELPAEGAQTLDLY